MIIQIQTSIGFTQKSLCYTLDFFFYFFIVYTLKFFYFSMNDVITYFYLQIK